MPDKSLDHALRLSQMVLLPLAGFLAIQVWKNTQMIAALPDQIPPPLFEDKVDDTRDQVRAIAADVSDLKTAMAEMGGNRFTSRDGLEVWKEINQIRQDLERHIRDDE